MDNLFKFGEESAEDALVVSADLVIGPYKINRGTSNDPELENEVEVDLESLKTQINLTVWEPPRHRVVFFDSLDDCSHYYKNSMGYYEEPEAVRVAGVVKEIDLDYKTAKIEINPNAIFKHPKDDSVKYKLYIRGLTEWKDNKIYFTNIYAYDLVLVEEGEEWKVR